MILDSVQLRGCKLVEMMSFQPALPVVLGQLESEASLSPSRNYYAMSNERGTREKEMKKRKKLLRQGKKKLKNITERNGAAGSLAVRELDY